MHAVPIILAHIFTCTVLSILHIALALAMCLADLSDGKNLNQSDRLHFISESLKYFLFSQGNDSIFGDKIQIFFILFMRSSELSCRAVIAPSVSVTMILFSSDFSVSG